VDKNDYDLDDQAWQNPKVFKNYERVTAIAIAIDLV
jgi:hypothetical protein